MASSSQAAASSLKRNHPENSGVNNREHVHRNWKQYKCACGSAMSSRNGFIYYCSICNERAAEKLARPTTNCSPYSSMAPSILANACIPVSMSLGMAAGPMIPGNYSQLPSTVNDSFRASVNAEASALLQKDTMTGASLGMAAGPMSPGNSQQLSAVNDSFRAFVNAEVSALLQKDTMTGASLGKAAGPMIPGNSQQLLTVNDSFRAFMNAEASALLQKDTMTAANLNNASLKKSMGSSLYGRAVGDKMNGDGGRGGGSTFEGMYNNLNVGGGSYGSAGGYGGGMERSSDQMNALYGGTMYNVNNVDGMLVGEVNNVMNVVAEPQMNAQSENCAKLITRDFLGLAGNGMNSLSSGIEYLSAPMSAPYGEMIYNVYNADGMLVGEVNNNVVVEPQMNVQNDNCDKPITRDFLGLMENGMGSLSGGGMVDDHNGNGMVTNSPDNEATTSAEARPSVRG